jgi:glycerol kinase
MPFVLALDQSTSATKALLFDEAGRCLGAEARDHRQHNPQPGWVEHDAEEIWRNALAVTRALLDRHPAAAGALAGVSVTNQRETIVVFERTTGRPLYPAIVWQCRRGDEFCAQHARDGHEAMVHARTGLRLDAYFSGSKLQWLVRHHPELRAKLAAGEALIGTIDTFLIYRLTAGKVFATDTTNASRTLLFDIGRLAWDDELCALWEVPRVALAEVRDSTARFGETTLGGALATAVPICGVMGDSQAALFAQGCFEPGTAKVTFGTGSSVLLNIGAKLRLSEQGIVTALAWTHRGVPTYAWEGVIISSAATVAWLRDQLGLISDFAETEQLAQAVPDTQGVYFIPAFAGLGLPHWEPAARAAIVGLSTASDRRHVVRAALESIGYQLRDVLETMRGDAGVTLRSLHGDGGPTVNRFLMQLTSDLTGAQLRISTVSDCSARGVALAAFLGLGLFGSLTELATMAREEVIYQPALPLAEAERLYAGWQSAVRRVLPEKVAVQSVRKNPQDLG